MGEIFSRVRPRLRRETRASMSYWSIILRMTVQAVSWQSVHDAP
jgi:hypothetical protein